MQLAFPKNNHSSFTFTLLWTFTTLGSFLLSLLWIEIGEKSDIGLLEAAVGGLAIALPQSYILRHRIFPLSWVLSTIFGWVIIAATGVGAVGWYVPSSQFFPLRIFLGIISGSIGGLVIGLAQWWIAMPQSLPWVWSWMFVSSASWAVAVSTGSAVGLFLHRLSQLFLGEVVGLAITWLIVAILTGISAYKLLK